MAVQRCAQPPARLIVVTIDFDVIVVGSGPAGVSAAFPLVEAGLQVLMVDGGRTATVEPPANPYLSERFGSDEQWRWMVGRDFHALRLIDAVSPKLRVPPHGYVFENPAGENPTTTHNFIAVGSLAQGGLSNAWGCGVARLSDRELAEFPFEEAELAGSYESVTRRIGVSGAIDDDLSDYFGLDAWAQPPIAMDATHTYLLERYMRNRHRIAPLGLRMGRSRVAALSRDMDTRKACNLSGNCLWGCRRKALYSSADELPQLARHDNFHYRSGFIVDRVASADGIVTVQGHGAGERSSIRAGRVVLAAGTLATTRLALLALGLRHSLPMQSSPTAAFLLWLPARLGSANGDHFGLGQVSFSLQLDENTSGFGSTFSPAGIPVAELVRHVPLARRYSIDILQHLLSSCLIGNLFLPGHLSTTRVALDADAALRIDGGYADATAGLMVEAAGRLRKGFGRAGALLLPMSFTVGRPGSDIHYSGTLPMRAQPTPGATGATGELAGLPGVHVVDGACLPTLTAKSHTLTIMANADRIARKLAGSIPGRT
jgi:choline dehydrogenase-like flavoprotein